MAVGVLSVSSVLNASLMPNASVMQESLFASSTRSSVQVEHGRSAARAEDRRHARLRDRPTDVRRGVQRLDGVPEFLLLGACRGVVVAVLRARDRREQVPVGLERAATPRCAPSGRRWSGRGCRRPRCWSSRSTPRPALRGLPFSSTMNLLCWMLFGFASRRITFSSGSSAVLDHLEILFARKARVELALLVGRLVDLGVDDDPHVDAAVDRRLQRLAPRRVAELVEAAEQRVASSALAMNLRIASSRSRLSHSQRALALSPAVAVVAATCCRTRARRPGCSRRRG